MKDNEVPQKGSAHTVEDFSSFAEGDNEPTLNKQIQDLIGADTDYIVYLDEDCFVEWSVTGKYDPLPQGFRKIANRIALLDLFFELRKTG